VDDPSVPDPLVIEKLFASIESEVAPVFKNLTKEKRAPGDEHELSVLVEYLAIQWIRVPTFRAVVREAVEAHIHERVLSSPEAWEQALQRAGTSPDKHREDYAKVLEGVTSGQLRLSAQPEFYLKQGAELLPDAGESLRSRRWRWLVSSSGQFIGSDNPIALDGAVDEPIGISNAGIVIFPVNRHLLLYGVQEPVETPHLTTKLIARHNTFAMLTANEQVYSHRPDFHWLDSANKFQNDWRLFSRDSFSPSS
jgi:hypothetical protein